MSNITETVPAALPPEDAQLWAEYQQVDAEELVYQLLSPGPEVMAQERQRFFESGGPYLPDLRPRDIDIDTIRADEAYLLGVKKSIPEQVESGHLQNAYRWAVNEKIANLRMVAAAATGDGRRFRDYNNFIYGKPEGRIFEAVADKFCSDAERLLTTAPEGSEAAKAAKSLLAQLGGNRGDASILLPDSEVFEAVREDHYHEAGYLALLLAGVERPEGRVTAETGDPILRRMINNLGTGQEIVDAPAWSNSPAAVRRPPDYDMTGDEFLEYNAHELRHGLERKNGLAGPIRLAATGFDRYERGNEGRAVAAEQLVSPSLAHFAGGETWQLTLARHLATSLGSGTAGKQMNFAETFDVIKNAYLVYGYSHASPEDSMVVEQQANDAAWNLVSYVYKGTDGTGEFGVYRRQIIYLEGNIANWEGSKDDPTLIQKGDLGKFDVTNLRHIDVLQKAGILPIEDTMAA